MIFGGDPLYLIYLIPVFLISLSFHEASHAYVSYMLGDPTAKNVGRLTLNPVKHIDILGAIMMLVSGFGWAKPVPINPMYYKNRKKGTMLVSLAGPMSNILLALLSAFPLMYLLYKYGLQRIDSFSYIAIIYNLCRLFFIINLNLTAFNLIPVPPLDGSKILSGILPSRHYFKLMQYENYIGIIFLLIVFGFPGVLSAVMNPITGALGSVIQFIVQPVVGLLL